MLIGVNLSKGVLQYAPTYLLASTPAQKWIMTYATLRYHSQGVHRFYVKLTPMKLLLYPYDKSIIITIFVNWYNAIPRTISLQV